MYNQINKFIYVGIIVLFSSAGVFIGCKSNDEKAKDENQQTVTTTTTNSTSEWTVYKENAETAIANNDERIKILKEKIRKSNTPNLDKLREKRIDALQEQNARLRSKIDDYKADEAKSDWQQFKADVQKELDDMDKSLKDLDKDSK